MFPFFETITGKVLLTFGMAMVPVLELRGAIPMGVAAGLPPLAACLIAIAGNLVPVPFIILLIRHIFNFLRETRFFGPKIVALERRAHLKGRVVQKYRLLGLDGGAGGLPAGYPAPPRLPCHPAGIDHRRGHYHRRDYGRGASVLSHFLQRKAPPADMPAGFNSTKSYGGIYA